MNSQNAISNYIYQIFKPARYVLFCNISIWPGTIRTYNREMRLIRIKIEDGKQWKLKQIKIHKSCNLPPLAAYISRKSNPFWFLSCFQLINYIAFTISSIWVWLYLWLCTSVITACIIYAFVTTPSPSESSCKNAFQTQDFNADQQDTRAASKASQNLLIYINIILIIQNKFCQRQYNLFTAFLQYPQMIITIIQYKMIEWVLDGDEPQFQEGIESTILSLTLYQDQKEFQFYYYWAFCSIFNPVY